MQAYATLVFQCASEARLPCSSAFMDPMLYRWNVNKPLLILKGPRSSL